MHKGFALSQIECVNIESLVTVYKEYINIPCQFLVAGSSIYTGNCHLFTNNGKLLYLGENFDKKKTQQVLSQSFAANTGKSLSQPKTLLEQEVVENKPLEILFIQSTDGDGTQVLILTHNNNDNIFNYKVIDFNNEIVSTGNFTVELNAGAEIGNISFNSDGSIYFYIPAMHKFYIQNIKKKSQRSFDIEFSSCKINDMSFNVITGKVLFAGLCGAANDKQNICVSVLDINTGVINSNPLKAIQSSLAIKKDYFQLSNFKMKENGGFYLIVVERGEFEVGPAERSQVATVVGNIIVFNYDENNNFKWEKNVERLIYYNFPELDRIRHYASVVNNKLMLLYNLKGEDGKGRIINLTAGIFNESGDYTSKKVIEYEKGGPLGFRTDCVIKTAGKSFISFQREKKDYIFTKLSFR